MKPIDEAIQLLRLRRLREQRALEAHARARASRDAAHAQVLRRRDELAGFDRALAALLRTLASADAHTMLRGAPYASARRDDLVYHRERCEYDLIDDEEALAVAERAIDEAAQHWRAALARGDAAADLLRRARRDALCATEVRLEREAPAAARIADRFASTAASRPLFPGARP
jgi:hypothetical protein